MNPARILIVEDELNVARTLKERLDLEGYVAHHVSTVKEALSFLASELVDLVILDVALPDGEGFQVADWIRRQGRTSAVLFLSAFAGPDERVRGFELGAEDYVPKPFHTKELLLRIKNVLGRATYIQANEEARGTVTIGKAKLDIRKFQIEVDGKTHSLSHKECALLKYLVDKRGSVVSRDEILDFVWSTDEYPTPRTVDNFIVRLRRLVETDPNQPELIRSIRGVGYQLADVESVHD
jgi:two-component system alkaline phosphatase synthesis response regulator PhoP